VVPPVNALRIVLAVVAALGMLAAGLAKVTRSSSMVKSAEHLGFSSTAHAGIGVLEVAAAVGLVIGIWVPLLGLLAAGGVVLLLVGAVISHARAGDGLGDKAPALVLGVVAVVTTALMSSAT
jgi:DoxX-like family